MTGTLAQMAEDGNIPRGYLHNLAETSPGGGEVIFRVCVKTKIGPLYTINARNEKMASVDDFPISKTCHVRGPAVGLEQLLRERDHPPGGDMLTYTASAPIAVERLSRDKS